MTRLRPARISDLSEIEAIVRAAFAPYTEIIGRRPAPMETDFAPAIRAGRIILAMGQQTEGVVHTELRNGEVWLDTLAVAPHAQGRGLGERLVAAAEDWARRRGASELKLYTNAAMSRNLSYYPRLGFIETHRAETEGFDRVFFVKSL